MKLGYVHLGLATGERERLLDEARAAAPTYEHVGSTLGTGANGDPATYVHRRIVGHGGEAFTAAREGLEAWVPQRSVGAEVVPSGQPPEPGATVVLFLGVGPLRVAVPNRIVAVVDEPRRYAYAYGTLPGHPEDGEESFSVELLDDQRVEVTIRLRARAAGPVLGALSPLVRAVQHMAVRRYSSAVARHVRQRGSRPEQGVDAPAPGG